MERLVTLTQLQGKTDLGEVGMERPISFHLNRGEIGVTTDGKAGSQLIRLLIGRGEISSGTLQIALREQNATSRRNEYDIAWRQEIGFAFRDKGLISNLTLLENIDLPARYHKHYSSREEFGSLAKKAAHELEISEIYFSKRPDFVPWEIRKRALLARSIVLDPALLLLDDPISMFQWESIPFLIRWVKKQKERRAIFVSSDNLPFSIAIADWMLDKRSHQRVDNFHSLFPAHLINSSELLTVEVSCEK